jgi:hypothetical protein
MSTVSAHWNANGFLENLVSIDYIDIVYKKVKHILNVCLIQSTCMGYQSGVTQNMYHVSICISGCNVCFKNNYLNI